MKPQLPLLIGFVAALSPFSFHPVAYGSGVGHGGQPPDPPTATPTPTCTFLPTSTPWPCADGMLSDGFENGSCSLWSTCGSGTYGVTCPSSEQAHSGSKSQRHFAEGGKESSSSCGSVRMFSVIPGHQYKVEVWVYVNFEGAPPAVYGELAEASCNDCDCPTLGDRPSVDITPANMWTWEKITIHSGVTLNSSRACLRLFTEADVGTAWVYFDELEITDLNTPTCTPTCTFLPTSTPWPCEDGEIKDGFEWSCDEWTYSGDNGAVVECPYEGDAYNRDRSHRYSFSDGAQTCRSVRTFSVVPGQQYKVEVWIKSSNSSELASLRGDFAEADCNSCALPTADDPPTVDLMPLLGANNVWSKVTVHSSVMINTGRACMRLYGVSQGAVWVLFDDLVITDLGPPDCTPTPTPHPKCLPWYQELTVGQAGPDASPIRAYAGQADLYHRNLQLAMLLPEQAQKPFGCPSFMLETVETAAADWSDGSRHPGLGGGEQ